MVSGVLITRDLRTQGKRWVSGDIRLPRAPGRAHHEGARAFMAEAARPLIPPAPPTISIRECQKAIEIAVGVNRCASPGSQPGISVVGSAEISGLRPKRRNSSPSGRGKSLWTRTKLPNSPFPPQGSPASRGPICAPPPKFVRSILSDCRCEVYPQAAVIRGSFRQVVRSGCSCWTNRPRNRTSEQDDRRRRGLLFYFYFSRYL